MLANREKRQYVLCTMVDNGVHSLAPLCLNMPMEKVQVAK